MHSIALEVQLQSFSPHHWMYGWKPQLPVDLYFGTQKADMNSTTSTKFVQQLHERLKWPQKLQSIITGKQKT